jgi:hypothetical protein
MKRLLFCLLACSSPQTGGQAGTKQKEYLTEESGSVDSGDGPPVLPSGDRILVWYGSGGLGPQSTGEGAFTTFDAHIKGETGFNTDHFEDLPEDLSPYRLILLVAPGHGDVTVPMAADQLERLGNVRMQGTRIIVFLERAACSTQATDDVLAHLGTGLAATGEAADTNRVVDVEEWANDPLTAGVLRLRFREPCFSSGGSALAWDSLGNPMISHQRPDRAGDVLVIGDPQVLDDGAPWGDPNFSHETFAFNLTQFGVR